MKWTTLSFMNYIILWKIHTVKSKLCILLTMWPCGVVDSMLGSQLRHHGFKSQVGWKQHGFVLNTITW